MFMSNLFVAGSEEQVHYLREVIIGREFSPLTINRRLICFLDIRNAKITSWSTWLQVYNRWILHLIRWLCRCVLRSSIASALLRVFRSFSNELRSSSNTAHQLGYIPVRVHSSWGPKAAGSMNDSALILDGKHTWDEEQFGYCYSNNRHSSRSATSCC